MSISCKHPERGPARANKIYVNTKCSSDGRNLEGYWQDYNPNEPYALYLLEFTLNLSEGVEYYSVYDDQGNRITNFRKEYAPKRI